MEITHTPISGVLLVGLVNHHDHRGSFTEDYRAEWAGTMPQSNISRSLPNVLRGMHFHRRQYDYWTFVGGSAIVMLHDIRTGSPTEGQAHRLELDAAVDLGPGILIPPGVAHAFYAVTDVTMHYMVSIYHDGTDEYQYRWDDVPVAWGVEEPILSERDSTSPHLSEIERPEFHR